MADGAGFIANDPLNPSLVLSAAAPLDSGREFIRRHYMTDGLRIIHHQNGCFYIWEGSNYREFSMEEIRSGLYRFLDGAFCLTNENLAPFNPNKTKVANVLEALAAEAQLAAHQIAPVWLDGRSAPNPVSLIAFSNALLQLPTRDMLAHTPALFTMNAVPYDYETNAKQPKNWLKFLADLWSDDQESIDALQEMFGLFLTGETRHQKAFLVIGPKRSGKGTIARVLTQLLGQANVCGPTLGGLAQNFGLAPLIGRRLAIISDARVAGRTNQQSMVERLLAITGEDALTIDRKFRDAWTGRLQTRFLILTNEVPQFSDASGALASRFITLVLKKSFYGQEDQGLTDTLLEEMPGILGWALDGWDNLARRKHFVEPASSRAVRQVMDDLGSPIGAFLRECCEVGPGFSVGITKLFERWTHWCLSQGLDRENAGSVQTFGRDLRVAIPTLDDQQLRGADGSRARYYCGLRLL